MTNGEKVGSMLVRVGVALLVVLGLYALVIAGYSLWAGPAIWSEVASGLEKVAQGPEGGVGPLGGIVLIVGAIYALVAGKR